MTDIKPRMVDGVGWCDDLVVCLHRIWPDDLLKDDYQCCCKLWEDGNSAIDDMSVCPVWAHRMAAWAEEARGAIAEPDGILGSGFLPLDWRDDLCALLSRYPGKDGE